MTTPTSDFRLRRASRAASMASGGTAWVRGQRDKLSARSRPLLTQLRKQWLALSARERKQVMLLAAILTVAIVWLLFTKPALDTVRHWNQEMPRLRSQAAALDEVLAEVSTPAASAQADSDDPIARTQASLDDAGLAGTYAIALEASELRITFASVDAQLLMAWLLGLSSAEITVREATLERLDATGSDMAVPISATVVANVSRRAGSAP